MTSFKLYIAKNVKKNVIDHLGSMNDTSLIERQHTR